MSTTTPCTPPALGEFSWNELITPDPAGSTGFYTKLFGWQTASFTPPGSPADAPPYTLFKARPDDMGVAGLMGSPQAGGPAQWHAYVVVADIDASLTKAVELGAKVMLPVMAVGGVGRVAVIQDPQGAVIGLHELAK